MGTKWKIWIWFQLLDGPKRFTELQNMLPQISRQTLAVELRGLEEMAVVHRQVDTEGSLKLTYVLTDLGQRSAPILRQLLEWGEWFCAQTGIEHAWPLTERKAG
jgi:DNA-binding HxlR family transcriptional regulator